MLFTKIQELPKALSEAEDNSSIYEQKLIIPQNIKQKCDTGT